MTKTLTLLALGASAIALVACSSEERALNKAPGTYESSTTSTNAAGTTTERKTTTDVSVDSQGKKKAVVKTKTSTDPKGLFNKTTNESTGVAEEK